MLSIRMQRLGRKGHPSYRVVVQDSRQSPTSGRYVELLGSYDPHTKKSSLVREKAEFYLSNGARPSDRVIKLFKSEKIVLPAWANEPTEKKREIRNPEKLRKNRPAETEDAPAETAEKPVDEAPPEAPAGDTAAEKPAEEQGEPAKEETEGKPAEAKIVEASADKVEDEPPTEKSAGSDKKEA